MALDEAILQHAAQRKVPPTLRLFAWDPPCLSLGIAQPASDVDLSALKARGWDIVRRPTGGRAILHTDELTYSVAAAADEDVVSGGVLESYRRLAAALIAALKRLELAATADREYDLPPGSSPNGAVCFEVPSKYEITVNGKKLIGSAQARSMGGVLQHGTLPLVGDLTRITQALAFPTEADRQEAARRLLAHATSVEMVLDRQVTWEQAARAFEEAFAEVLEITLIESQPTPEECDLADELLATKYGHPDWTYRI